MTKIFRIENLCCPNCAKKVETAVSKLSGVESVVYNFFAEKMTVTYDGIADDALLAAIRKAATAVESDAEVSFA